MNPKEQQVPGAIITSLAELLEACQCTDSLATLEASNTTFEDIVTAFEHGRPKCLALLKDKGIDKLNIRQSIATAMTKADREKRIFFERLAPSASGLAKGDVFLKIPTDKLKRKPRIAVPKGRAPANAAAAQ